ncbi:MAG: SCO family protein [Betaproteobacteria bacterium]|nr:MAG: SCO family protein [Betaproteobacteria bacterium]
MQSVVGPVERCQAGSIGARNVGWVEARNPAASPHQAGFINPAYLLAFAAALAITFLSGCSRDGKPAALKFNTTDITGASFGQSLSLNDAATQQPRTLADFKGKVTVFFFGYMFCPDYCPTTMTTLNAALAKMKPSDAENVNVVFVTVDPKRDVPAELTKYVNAFNPKFKALYGTDEQTAAAAKEFKIIYQKAQIKDENTYLVDHSTQMYVFDPQGRIRLLVRHEAGADAIAADLSTLLRS